MLNRKKQEQPKLCPLLKKTCIGSDCMWATKMRGTDPNTGNDIDEESCAITWLPMLLTENIKAAHETGAAVESFRNETVKHQHGTLQFAKKLVGFVGLNRITEEVN